jgi:sodium/bile acid cotransporter 7
LKVFLNLFKKFWFILGLLVVLLCAYLYPRLGATGGIIRAEYTVKYGCVIIIFFLSGLSLPTKNLIDQLFRFRLHLLIQVLSLLIVPFTVFAIALLLAKTSLNKVLISGIMVMASTCTSISTNVRIAAVINLKFVT